MKFELHCHSWFSKGSKIPTEGLSSPEEIAQVLKKKGFGGFAITDHDSIVSWKGAEKEAKKLDILFIPSLEISTNSGHLIGLGISEYVKPRMDLFETIDEIHDQGGLAIAPHPFDIRGEGIGNDFKHADAVEIFNSLNLTRVDNIIALKRAKKQGISAVGGSDAHSKYMLGMTTNEVNADNIDIFLKKVKKGEVEVRGKYIPIPIVVKWAKERMRLSYDDIIKYCDNNYPLPKRALSKYMLRHFVNSESEFWNYFGRFSVSIAVMYSLILSLNR